jgi:hypothetical protein
MNKFSDLSHNKYISKCDYCMNKFSDLIHNMYISKWDYFITNSVIEKDKVVPVL